MQKRNELNDLRVFGMVLGIMLMVLSGVFIYRFQDTAQQSPVLRYGLVFLTAAGFVLLLLGYLAPAAIRPIYRVWMPIATKIGEFNTGVILWVTYYVVLCPFAVLRKLFGKDDLRWKYAERETYFVRKDGEPVTLEQCRKQF